MKQAFPTQLLAGVQTPRVGLGCMGMSEFYGPTDDETNLVALHTAYAMGYRHFDSADMYGQGANERLLSRFLRELGAAARHGVLLATKVGIERKPEGGIAANSRPEYIRRACDASLQRLGIDCIDLLYLHRKTPEVPIEDSVGAMLELVQLGKVRSLGLSEVSAPTLTRACAVGQIEALQSEYSLWSRDIERLILPTCQAHGVTLVAYSPLGRGFLTANMSREQLAEGDLRRRLPRFQEDNFHANQALLEAVRSVATALSCEPAQAALAWLLSRTPDLHVIPGSRRKANMEMNLNSMTISLSAAQQAMLSAAFDADAVHGGRYPEALLATVNV
jgi:aryl-alcohol dehydrogenase-like predicted oxidoreductase